MKVEHFAALVVGVLVALLFIIVTHPLQPSRQSICASKGGVLLNTTDVLNTTDGYVCIRADVIIK